MASGDDQPSTSNYYSAESSPSISLSPNNIITSQPIVNQLVHKPRLHIFDGIKKNVTIENWCKMYESAARRYNWSDEDIVDLLNEYLDGDALNFYLYERDNCDWFTIKSKLINRFGIKAIEPLEECVRLKFHHKKNVTEYFEEKRRLANLALLSESQAVVLLIEGLNDQLRNCFLGHRINTYDQFFAIAKSAENQLPSYHHNQGKFNRNQGNRLPSIINNRNNNNNENRQFVKRQPKSACWICENAGKPNQMHWKEDCPIRQERQHQHQPHHHNNNHNINHHHNHHQHQRKVNYVQQSSNSVDDNHSNDSQSVHLN